MSTDTELAALARIPVEILRAIRAIESGSSPSAVRFEPHVFHRETGGRFTTAQVPWTPSGRPSRESVSYVASETNRAAFERARRFDARAAVAATSWGLYQQMGSTLLRLEPDPTRAVAMFDSDPRGTSDRLLVEWFRARPAAAEAARAGDIDALARSYNGSGWTPWAEALRRALARGAGAVEGAASAAGSAGAPGWIGPVLGTLAGVGAAVATWAALGRWRP